MLNVGGTVARNGNGGVGRSPRSTFVTFVRHREILLGTLIAIAGSVSLISDERDKVEEDAASPIGIIDKGMKSRWSTFYWGNTFFGWVGGT